MDLQDLIRAIHDRYGGPGTPMLACFVQQLLSTHVPPPKPKSGKKGGKNAKARPSSKTTGPKNAKSGKGNKKSKETATSKAKDAKGPGQLTRIPGMAEAFQLATQPVLDVLLYTYHRVQERDPRYGKSARNVLDTFLSVARSNGTVYEDMDELQTKIRQYHQTCKDIKSLYRDSGVKEPMGYFILSHRTRTSGTATLFSKYDALRDELQGTSRGVYKATSEVLSNGSIAMLEELKTVKVDSTKDLDTSPAAGAGTSRAAAEEESKRDKKSSRKGLSHPPIGAWGEANRVTGESGSSSSDLDD